MRRRSAILFALPVLLVLGCAESTEGRLIGVWSIDNGGTVIPKTPFRTDDRIRTLLANFRVKVLADHKLLIFAGQTTEGTWSFENGKLNWQLEKGFLGNLMQNTEVALTPDMTHIDVTGATVFGPIKIRLRKTG